MAPSANERSKSCQYLHGRRFLFDAVLFLVILGGGFAAYREENSWHPQRGETQQRAKRAHRTQEAGNGMTDEVVPRRLCSDEPAADTRQLFLGGRFCEVALRRIVDQHLAAAKDDSDDQNLGDGEIAGLLTKRYGQGSDDSDRVRDPDDQRSGITVDDRARETSSGEPRQAARPRNS